jgi:hypothetical protein
VGKLHRRAAWLTVDDFRLGKHVGRVICREGEILDAAPASNHRGAARRDACKRRAEITLALAQMFAKAGIEVDKARTVSRS